ncbi:MAG: hypothetical protein H3C58_06965 [Fimbriimonadaceae bacterium]|nr:hypothetical protein [Fimbriimonadaceae bacterium]
MMISLFASAFALGQIAASESTPRAPTTEVRFAVSHALDEGDTFLVAIHDAKGKELGGSQLGPDGFTYVEGRSTSIAKPTYTLDIQLKDGATYHAVVTVPSTLRRVLTFKGKGKGVIELSVSLVMGDVDQNGVVDEYDQEYVLRHEGFRSKDEAKWTDFDLLGRIVWHADLNRDGKIDHTDFSKVTQSLGKRNDPLPWQKRD